MTLSGLHRKFLKYCEVERRLASQTVIAYRSDFLQFLEFLGRQFRWGLVSQDTLATFSAENIRGYQYYMAQQGWSRATVHRRLVSLNRFAGWLIRIAKLVMFPRGRNSARGELTNWLEDKEKHQRRPVGRVTDEEGKGSVPARSYTRQILY